MSNNPEEKVSKKKALLRVVTQYADTKKAKEEAKEFFEKGKSKEIKKEMFMFGKKSVNVVKLYCHFFESIDYLLVTLAIIGSFVSGASVPIMFYLMAQIYSDIGNTSEATVSIEDLPAMMEIVEDSLEDQMKKQLIFGAITFVSKFIAISCWTLLGDRVIYNFKKKYFALLLAQKQGLFDTSNAFQFSTKIQTQISKIQGGIGDNTDYIIFNTGRAIVGIILSFVASWKISIVEICIAPIGVGYYAIVMMVVSRGQVFGRKIWEEAGGIAEEMLYNVKTISSFANFEYELKKFQEKVELVLSI